MLSSARARLKAGVDVVVGVVETHGRAETEALLQGLEVVAAQAASLSRPDAGGDGPRRGDRARGRRLALVDELAHTNAPGSRHPKRYLDVEELLSHGIDVYTADQHPAHREPQRRRRPDHPCAGARDRAGLGGRSCRRHRADRPHARRPDPAAEGGQSLCAQAGRACAGALFLARQPDRAARTGAAPHRRTRSTSSCSPTCRPMRSPGPWARGRTHPGLRQRETLARPAWCVMPSGWPTGCMRNGRAVSIETRRSLQLSDEQRDRLADTMRLARVARRRGADAARGRPPHRRRRHQLRPGQQRHPDHHRQVDALALVRADARLGGARPGAPGRQYQRQRDRRRRAAVGKAGGADRGAAASRSSRSPI